MAVLKSNTSVYRYPIVVISWFVQLQNQSLSSLASNIVNSHLLVSYLLRNDFRHHVFRSGEFKQVKNIGWSEGDAIPQKLQHFPKSTLAFPKAFSSYMRAFPQHDSPFCTLINTINELIFSLSNLIFKSFYLMPSHVWPPFHFIIYLYAKIENHLLVSEVGSEPVLIWQPIHFLLSPASRDLLKFFCRYYATRHSKIQTMLTNLFIFQADKWPNIFLESSATPGTKEPSLLRSTARNKYECSSQTVPLYLEQMIGKLAKELPVRHCVGNEKCSFEVGILKI